MVLGEKRLTYTHDDFPYDSLPTPTFETRGKTQIITNFFATFDIETTSINMTETTTTSEYHDAYMYIWQMCVDHRVIFGRKWEELLSTIDSLKRHLKLKRNQYLVMYVHNLSFEFQFLTGILKISHIFATERRKLLRCILEDFIEARCSYRLSNMSLDRFLKQAKNVPSEYQKGGDFDYSLIRTSITPLTTEEYNYCYNDVYGLYLAIEDNLEYFNDTLATIPYTSTGYVRRDAKEAMTSTPTNKKVLANLVLSLPQYAMCKMASRGGNAHANPTISNTVLTDVESKDMSSAYPGVMLQCKFPMTRFILDGDDPYDLKPNKAYLLTLELHDVRIKTINTIPYISYAKCLTTYDVRNDNGRIIEAAYLRLVCTDIDWKIISSTYDIGAVDLVEEYSALYGYLPKSYRKYIFSRYIQKCELKTGDPYLYAKEKNKINALFGMMLTDIVHDEVIYDPHTDPVWRVVKAEEHEALAKHYDSPNYFLAYQWGLWVTAHCRRRLQMAIDELIDHDITVVYCDTDSVKYQTNGQQSTVDAIFEGLNADIAHETEQCGFETSYTSSDGLHFELGHWEDDGHFEFFKTLGSKKYYCIENGKHSITVAGLSKKKGVEFLKTIGGINAFKPGTVVPAKSSGRTTSHYIDSPTKLRKLSIVDPFFERTVEQKTASALAIENVPYTFSITDEYASLIEDLQDFYEKPLW